ncbi:MAG: hypothetical protein Q9214_001896 [Letrouitia sp. 1 TL-2023]
MPIKLPKAFPRRKSSGNALEELSNPPEPSFRVFERPDRKSFDGGNTLKRMSVARPLSAGHSLENNLYNERDSSNRFVPKSDGRKLRLLTISRGSAGTNTSSSSGRHNDNSSSSARFSSSSTLPSSTDIPLDDKNPTHPYHVPTPPIPESHPLTLRAAGRTFSFGRRKPQLPAQSTSSPRLTDLQPPIPEASTHNRERASTESSYASASTATPPKIMDTGFDLGGADLDNFGDMFENFGKRRSALGGDVNGLGLTNTDRGLGDGMGRGHSQDSSESMSTTGSATVTSSYVGERPPQTPSPFQLNRSSQIESSPYSGRSHRSHDGLISSPSPVVVSEQPYAYDEPHHRGLTQSRTTPIPPSRAKQIRQSVTGSGLRRSSAYASRRDSAPLQDEDARLVMDSIRYLNRVSTADSDPPMRVSEPGDDNETRDTSSLLGPSYHSFSPDHSSPQRKPVRGPAELFGSNDVDNMDTMGSVETTPRAKNSELTKRSSLFDSSLNPSSRSSPSTFDSNRGHPQTGPQNKVMTPAQFERYRREQEMLGGGSKTDVSDDDSDHYDDDDEAERNKLLAKQRRKQEAHLAVYRQQMMKMTGEQPSDLPDIGPLRPGLERASVSAPTVGQRGFAPTFSIDKASKNSDDEDENIPLGVLAAHGFPNKNRPPTALANNGVQYSSESYPPPPKSTSGASIRALPPFAKNLPPDPYYGAGLVNPSNRETPSFSTHGGSTYGGPSPNMPPGGLVGVIAGEERARAMRRGSPNTQGSYGSPLPQGMSGGMPPVLSPGDEAQLQMSQQMSQMMQMQMQWMQQMQQMMAGQQQQQQPPPPQPPPHQLPQLPLPLQQGMTHNFLSPQGQPPRPMSHSAPGSPALTQQQQRAMSMMSPTMSPQWAHQGYGKAQPGGGLGGPAGYAPSIAPSERSNVGMPTRYRPVSIAPADEHARPASQASSQMLLQAGGDRRINVSPANNSNNNSKSSPSPRKVPSDDDDDEEGWEEMKKKRQQKASTWRLKKSRGDDLKEMYYPGA